MPGYAFKYDDTKPPKVVNKYKEPFDVYIGRKGKGKWGNPVAMGRTCPECGQVHRDRGSTLQCYKRWLWRRMKADPGFVKEIRSLAGRTLGCYCKPHPCHGDVLRAACAWLIEQERKEEES